MRLARLWMQFVDREVAIDELDPLPIPRYELFERRLHALAEGTVEVLKLDDCHRRRGRSLGRSPVRPHLGSEDRRSLEMEHHLGLGTERFQERLPPGREF